MPSSTLICYIKWFIERIWFYGISSLTHTCFHCTKPVSSPAPFPCPLPPSPALLVSSSSLPLRYGDPGKAGESLVGEATILRDKAKDYTERSVGILNVMEKPDMDEILRLIDAIDLKIDDGEAIRELLALPRDRFLQQQVNHNTKGRRSE